MGCVRAFVEGDIQQVADLYWTFIRHRKGPSPPALHSLFQELYFTSPWVDSAHPSVVYEDERGVVGFLGVIPRTMSLCGQSIRVAFGGNFVVHPEARTTLAGLRILREYMAGDQDLSGTDSANDISRLLLERLGFRTIVACSIHWVRPLRPGHYAVYQMSRLTGPALSAGLKFAAKPLCSIVYGLAAKLTSSPFRQAAPALHATELDVETHLNCLAEFRSGYSLWPEYDLHSLDWLLSFMNRTQAYGKKLRKVVLRDDRKKIVGWYVYYLNPGAVGEVVQIGGERQFTKIILDHLFFDAWNHGMIALHGSVHSRLMDDFSDKNCIFTCRGGWTLAHSRRSELLELLNRGDAFLSHLDGEWCMSLGEGSRVS